MASEQTEPLRLKILLVDDDDLVREAIEDVLSDAGFEVVATADPHEALGLPDAIGPPGVVITDTTSVHYSMALMLPLAHIFFGLQHRSF
jgi:DNA-binding NarL/FixJ family response regulator